MPRGRKDDQTDAPSPERQAADADSTDLRKRLKDNQPLSDTDEIRDEKMGERRQYGVRDVDAAGPDRGE